jgi:hypothetical protein
VMLRPTHLQSGIGIVWQSVEISFNPAIVHAAPS